MLGIEIKDMRIITVVVMIEMRGQNCILKMF